SPVACEHKHTFLSQSSVLDANCLCLLSLSLSLSLSPPFPSPYVEICLQHRFKSSSHVIYFFAFWLTVVAVSGSNSLTDGRLSRLCVFRDKPGRLATRPMLW